MAGTRTEETGRGQAHLGITVPMLLVLGALSAVPPLSFDMYLPALPQVADSLGVPEAQIQLTLSACLLGLAFGQLFGGPISDSLGRRRPLLVGVGGYAVASLACAFAPTASALVVLRFAQGLLGGVAVVIARAIVRDREEGAAAARVFSLLMLVSGIAPIAAPLFGGLLISITSWRGIFVTLSLIGAAGLLAVTVILPETLAPENRHAGGIGETLAVAKRVLRHRPLLGYAFTAAFSSGALFFYISCSSFVFQDIYGLTSAEYSLVFAVNAVALMGVGWLNANLVRRHEPAVLLRWGVWQALVGAAVLCAVLWLDLGLPAVLPALLLTVASLPFIVPNATALALAPYSREAGSVSALLGVLQFAVGAIASPLASVAGEVTAFSMAFGMLIMGMLALVTRRVLVPT
ncbi:MAG TPA: multidrug effflux MFS transporter [Acidimicrobiales bacterium]|nr:multidrug effflux MFS transporter [Acidimicrobiales bacterium]